MKLKKILFISMLILILSVSAASAADENVTWELTLDDAQDLEVADDDIAEVETNEIAVENFNVPKVKRYGVQYDFSYDYYFENDGGSIDVYLR